jgi:hypothetical protein
MEDGTSGASLPLSKGADMVLGQMNSLDLGQRQYNSSLEKKHFLTIKIFQIH